MRLGSNEYTIQVSGVVRSRDKLYPDKMWVVIAGAVAGLIILRFAATYFIRILERFPMLDHVAYLLVGWAGVKLILISGHSFERWYVKPGSGNTMPFHIPEMPPLMFWAGMAIIAIGGTWYAVKKGGAPEEAIAADREGAESVGSPE